VVVDKLLAANLLQIGGLDNFSPFRTMLQEQRDKWRDMLESMKEPEQIYRAQGRAQQLKEILDLLDQAPSLADKYRG